MNGLANPTLSRLICRHAQSSKVYAIRILGAFAGTLAMASAAQSSCLPLPSPEFQMLDAQTETQPELAVETAQARITSTAGQSNARLAQLYAVMADAYTELSQLDKARDAIALSRGVLEILPDSADVFRLKLRLDLLKTQLLIADANSAAAVLAINKLLLTVPANTLEQACTLSVRSVAYDYLHQPDLAVSDALIAYRIAQAGQWRNARLESAGTLARIFGGTGLYPQAERMIDVVIAIAREDGKTALLSTAEYERGMILVKARRFAEARAALQQSKVYAIQIGDRFGVAAADATLCWALVREGDLAAADRVCSARDDDLASGQRKDLYTQLIGNRARLDLERQRPAAALRKLNRILTPSLHAQLPGSESQFYWDRARALLAMHREREASIDLVRMHKLEESADTDQRNRQVAVLSAMIASEDLTAANRQLLERMQLQQTEATREHQQRTTLFLAALIISTLLGYLLWISQRHSRALRRQEIILRSAGHNAPDAFILLDEERRILFANRNLCGEGQVPVVGESVLKFVPPALVHSLKAAIDEAFERRIAVNIATSAADSNASVRQLAMCVVPAVEQDRVVGGTLRAVDVTDQRELEREVIDSASRERERLSGVLHEGLGQQLAGMLLLLGNALSATRRALSTSHLLEEVIQYMREAMDETRELARGLAPVKIGMGSLTIALDSLAVDAVRRLRVPVVCDCRLEGRVLSDLAADHFYCICREAVTNAAFHGRCSNVRIAIEVEGETITMSITDDGRGIANTTGHSRGLGIRMMAYRARLLGGTLEIIEAPHGGTCVIVRVGLERVEAQTG